MANSTMILVPSIIKTKIWNWWWICVSERPPEHTDYLVEETHQVLKYVQDRADAPMYARDPQVKMIEKSKLEINKYKKFSKNKIRITKKSSSKRSKYSHEK